MIKKLLYCGLMLLTINTFALQINWSEPKESYSKEYYQYILNEPTFRKSLVVGGDKLIYFCYDNRKYNYRVCLFDNDNNLNVLKTTEIPLADIKDIISKFGSLDKMSYPYHASIPNSNTFLEIMSDYSNSVNIGIYRIATVQEDNTITWSPIQDLPENLFKNKNIRMSYATVTDNGYVVLIGKHSPVDRCEVYCAYGKLDGDNIEWKLDKIQKVPTDIEYESDGIFSLGNEYFIIISRSKYIIGKIDDNNILSWGSHLDMPYIYSYMQPAYIKHLDKFITPRDNLIIYNIDYDNYKLIPDVETITGWNQEWWGKYFYGNSTNITYFEKTQNLAVLEVNNWDEKQPYHTIGTFSDNLPSDAPLKGKGL